MKPPADSQSPFAGGTSSPFAEIRYSLSELLAEGKLDRASKSFAMEKLDQGAITKLFEEHRARRAAQSRK